MYFFSFEVENRKKKVFKRFFLRINLTILHQPIPITSFSIRENNLFLQVYKTHIKVSSISSFRGIFDFISSWLLCERKWQCKHCDRLTNSKLTKKSKNTEKFIFPTIYDFQFKTMNLYNSP